VHYLSFFLERIKAIGRFIKNIDDKEPIHTFYYLLGNGFLVVTFLFLSQSYLLANILCAIYLVVYIVFYIFFNGKGYNKKIICIRALVLDLVISILIFQVLLIM